ncbi:hypothetical protein JX266_003698 [Neoarthrinium moseri]|nr:hypothetical protein JX266_003698 [Neoarthrinium moseri]
MTLPASPQPASLVPAQVGFLAIFNPTLGATDETIDDQIVYYASVNSQSQTAASPRRRHRGSQARPTEGISHDERNERLRQIGLAQGMVDFGRDFADGRSVDTIDTERARVVLRELEPGWWILASIDLTKLPLPPRLGAAAKDDASDNFEYSSREVKPATLLLQDLLRAHSTFLLHHAASLSALFVKTKRTKFVALLSRYWDLFLSTWSVMLRGNPACSMYGGIKIAACGELGVGVGEEERGSGEREVLEGFVDRVEGLVDVVVAKFGDADPEGSSPIKGSDDPSAKWLGTGEEPGAEDGAIFLGVGALSSKSLRDVFFWMEDVYTWGEDAYGVKDSPTSTRVKAKRQRLKSVSGKTDPPTQPSQHAGDGGATAADDQTSKDKGTAEQEAAAADDGGSSKLMHYLKLGYGTHWSLGGSEAPGQGVQGAQAGPERPKMEARSSSRPSVSASAGHYLIGLQGDVESNTTESEGTDGEDLDSRTLVRTLTVELESEALGRAEEDIHQDLGSGDHELATSKSGRKDFANTASQFDSQDRNKAKKMRVVVYVSKPFVYTFLFQNRTDSLAWDSLYKKLHYQLEPLRRPLALSTSYRPEKPDAGSASSHIFDLIWDPRTLTIHSTIPNIPDPLAIVRSEESQRSVWTRVEAISTHTQILQTFSGTRQDTTELERTCKTNRGWWVVWTRITEARDIPASGGGGPPQLPSESSQDSAVSAETVESTFSAFPSPSPAAADSDARQGGPGTAASRRRQRQPGVSKEIFLIHRAGEGASRGRSLSQISEMKEGWGDGASRLAQGIGVDTKKYIDGLLSLAH